MVGGFRIRIDDHGQAWFSFAPDEQGPYPLEPEEDEDVARRWDFTFIDLFAGIGGFRLALEPLGGRCVFTCEIDEHARRTYAKWFDEDPNDLTRFARDIRQVETGEPGSIPVPDHDLLAAGFPCQPFSLAGVSKKNSLGRPHGFACQEQGNLFLDIIRIAKKKKTPALLLENVKHLERHDRGRTWNRILHELHEAGYIVLHQVIDARYWVPQHRERIFIACFRRKSLPEGLRDELQRREKLIVEGRLRNPLRIRRPPQEPTLAEILETDPSPKYTLSPRLWNYLREYRRKHQRLGNGFGFGLVDPKVDRVTRTLSARYYKDGSEILIGSKDPDGEPLPGHLPRRLTPVECARLMGFGKKGTKKYSKVNRREDIPVSDTQAYRQFGNALVPDVARAVARTVLDILEKAELIRKIESSATPENDIAPVSTAPASIRPPATPRN